MATQAATRQPPAVDTSRMTLGAIRTGKRRTPDRVLLAGTEGIGKTTWGADSPSPIFIPAEDGVDELDVPSFPKPTAFGDVIAAIRELKTVNYQYKTLVIDTVDAVEPLIWRKVCEDNKWDNLEAPGYGRGYALTADAWRELLFELESLQVAKGMGVILLAHTAIKNFSNPAGQDYARYEIKLHRTAAALLREWTKANLFAVHEEFTKKDKGELRVKGVSTGRRVVHTERTAAWDAKNRYNLPLELPLNYADYAEARDRVSADPAKLIDEANALLADLNPPAEKRTLILDTITKAGTNAVALAKCVDRLKSLIAEKE